MFLVTASYGQIQSTWWQPAMGKYKARGDSQLWANTEHHCDRQSAMGIDTTNMDTKFATRAGKVVSATHECYTHCKGQWQQRFLSDEVQLANCLWHISFKGHILPSHNHVGCVATIYIVNAKGKGIILNSAAGGTVIITYNICTSAEVS